MCICFGVVVHLNIFFIFCNQIYYCFAFILKLKKLDKIITLKPSPSIIIYSHRYRDIIDIVFSTTHNFLACFLPRFVYIYFNIAIKFFFGQMDAEFG